MSSGHRTQGYEQPTNDELESQLSALLDDRKFEAAVRSYDKVNDKHDVAWLAGSEKDGQTVDFDKDFNSAIEDGKIKLGGEPFDPRPFIRIHEAIEGAILRRQFDPKIWKLAEPSYDIAHQIALCAEHLAVEEALGAGAWAHYNKALDPHIKQDTPREIRNPPPGILRDTGKQATGEAMDFQPRQTIPGSTWDPQQNRWIMPTEPVTVPGDTPLTPIQTPEGRTRWISRPPQAGGARMQATGARLTAAQRKRIPAKDFALPGGRYPINDPNHARNALARVSQFGSSEEKARVRAAVHRKYPGIGKQSSGARMDVGPMQFDTPNLMQTQPGMAQYLQAGIGLGKALRPTPAAPGPVPTNYTSALPQEGGARLPPLPKHGAGHYMGDVPGARKPKHEDEDQDLALIKRVLREHEEEKQGGGARWFRMPSHIHQNLSVKQNVGKHGQYGARMPNHMHALSIASATHLNRAGHLDKKQMNAIHAKARNAMSAGMPPAMPQMQEGPAIPSFGALGGAGGQEF